MESGPPLLKVTDVRVDYAGVISVLKASRWRCPRAGWWRLLGATGRARRPCSRRSPACCPRGRRAHGGADRAGRPAPDGMRPPRWFAGGDPFMEGRRLFEHLTVEENLYTGAYLRAIAAASRPTSRRCMGTSRCCATAAAPGPATSRRASSRCWPSPRADGAPAAHAARRALARLAPLLVRRS